MSQFHPNITAEALTDKVIVITGLKPSTLILRALQELTSSGGANGIGASFVELCCQNGAYVCFGDTAVLAGDELARKLCESLPSSSSRPRATFCQTNVTEYKSIVSLFDKALETYRHIDHVVAGAGIVEIGNWFDPNLTLEEVREVC